jgi:hypothetical protein
MTQEEALRILKAGKNIYLTGPAGSGKTFVLNEYVSYLRERGVSVAVTASTGIAATHLGGVTIHSWSGLGIKGSLTTTEIDNLIQKESLYKKYEKTKVLIIDEVSMLKPQMFDSINRLAQAILGNEKPFGGMQVVLSGDFFQLPPVVKYGEEAAYIDASESWQNMDIRICYLEEQHRQTDNKLNSILSEIRKGEISEGTFEILESMKGVKTDNGFKPTRLHTHNINVDEVNDTELDKIDEEEISFEIKTHGRPSSVDSLVKGLLTPSTLRLKKNAAVMFVKNNFEAGYVNGTLGTVVGFDSGLPVVETKEGKIITVEPETWEILDDGKIIASAEQFPLRLAWAITIHKSQGMSLDAAEIDLSRSFVPGQGYVALSRLRSLDGLTLLGINNMALSIDPYVLRLDNWLRRESSKWSQVITRFTSEDMDEIHNKFVKDKGGTIDEGEIKDNKSKAKEKAKYAKTNSGKKPSHEITMELVEKGMNLNQIASERGVKQETVISHLEKLKKGEYFDDKKMKTKLKAFKPATATLAEIKKAVKKKPDAKLTTLYRNLGGKYSFEELRIARLFI